MKTTHIKIKNFAFHCIIDRLRDGRNYAKNFGLTEGTKRYCNQRFEQAKLMSHGAAMATLNDTYREERFNRLYHLAEKYYIK